MPVFSDNDRLDWLRLTRSENVGVKTFSTLLSLYGSAKAALQAIPALSRQGGRKTPIVLCSKDQAEREMAACKAMGAAMIAACEPTYPQLLLQTDSYPPLITVTGRVELLNRPAIGMVGAECLCQWLPFCP